MSDAILFHRPKSDNGDGDRHTLRIVNRFGTLELDPMQSVTVQGGMLGFPGDKDFCLINYPGRDNVKLFQSMTQPDLCFIVLPQRIDNYIHDSAHILAAIEEEQYDPESTILLLVVSAHGQGIKRIISCNAKAPIFYDCSKQLARQKALIQGNYSLRSPMM